MSTATMPDHHSAPVNEGRDLTPYFKQAREDIHESLMSDGIWPTTPHTRIQIEIEDYYAALPVWEQREVLRMLWPDHYGDHDDLREKVKGWHSDRIKEWIPANLVEQLAADMEQQSREDAETDEEYAERFGEAA